MDGLEDLIWFWKGWLLTISTGFCMQCYLIILDMYVLEKLKKSEEEMKKGDDPDAGSDDNAIWF